MERMYRKTVLLKKKFQWNIIAGSLFLLLVVRLVSNISGEALRKFIVTGTNGMQPAVITYQEKIEKKTDAPLAVRLWTPGIFAYTWKEELPVFSLIEVEKQEDIENENGVNEIKRLFYHEVTEKEVLSLLQENLYVKEEKTEEIHPIEQLDVNKVLDVSEYADVSKLIKDFYVVDISTSPDPALLDIQKLTSYDCTIDKHAEGPQILIYHSHSQEAFVDSVAGDVSTTIVGAGEKLTRLLEEVYGFEVLHHTGVYDYPSRDDAYSNALPAIEQVLKENPTIQVVIDLHRDATAEGTKLATTIDGKDYARFMFFNGICRGTDGPITYLNNPYLQENLSFSFQAQQIAEQYFPGITRKIYLKAWRYNMHFKPRNMLIELGAQTNTVEEIMNTTEILAFVINEVLSRQ